MVEFIIYNLNDHIQLYSVVFARKLAEVGKREPGENLCRN